jgi:excinuclease ABC subunit A
MPQSDHEDVAAEPKSATGQYLKPLLERASVQPVKPQPVKKSRKGSSAEDQPDLIAAK